LFLLYILIKEKRSLCCKRLCTIIRLVSMRIWYSLYKR